MCISEKIALFWWKLKNETETASSNGAIRSKFNEEFQHQIRRQIQYPISTFLVKIRFKFNAPFSWKLVKEKFQKSIGNPSYQLLFNQYS